MKTRNSQKLASDKRSKFLFYPNETLWKWLSHEVIIFPKFHEDMTKNVDFILLVNFLDCLVSISSDFRFQKDLILPEVGM